MQRTQPAAMFSKRPGGGVVTELTLERIPECLDHRPEAAPFMTVAAFGQLDIATAAGFERELTSDWAECVVELTLDLAGIEFMDSAGLHALERVCRHRRSSGRQTRLVQVPPQTKRLFQVAANAYLSVAASQEPLRRSRRTSAAAIKPRVGHARCSARRSARAARSRRANQR